MRGTVHRALGGNPSIVAEGGRAPGRPADGGGSGDDSSDDENYNMRDHSRGLLRDHGDDSTGHTRVRGSNILSLKPSDVSKALPKDAVY